MTNLCTRSKLFAYAITSRNVAPLPTTWPSFLTGIDLLLQHWSPAASMVASSQISGRDWIPMVSTEYSGHLPAVSCFSTS